MTLAKRIVLATLALATLAFTALSANADTHEHIDTLAVKMQSQSRELIKEFARHYRHKPGYAHLHSDGVQLYRAAAHIHLIAHQHGSIHHLQSDLRKADRLFHHLEGVLKQTDQSFGGHTHGAAYHVFELMHELEDTLHHLKSDIESLDAAAHYTSGHHGTGHHGTGHHGFGYGQPYQPSHSNHASFGYRWGGGGVSISGRRWNFRLGY